MRASHWRASAITFGPVGRLVSTGLVFAPIPGMLKASWPFACVGVPAWSVFVVPFVLRDIWRGVPVAGGAQPAPARGSSATGAYVIGRRAGTARW